MALEHACSTKAAAEAPIGYCDASAWALRCRSFGNVALCQTRCSSCDAELELDLPAAIVPAATEPVEVPCLEVDGYRVQARLPSLADVASVCRVSRNVSLARRMLVERCVSWATQGDVVVAASELPETVIAGLAEHLDPLDPAARIVLACDCAECGARCEVSFDPAGFFAAELEAEAARLIREVDTLARAYGWSESAILGLSRLRRQQYLAVGVGP